MRQPWKWKLVVCAVNLILCIFAQLLGRFI